MNRNKCETVSVIFGSNQIFVYYRFEDPLQESPTLFTLSASNSNVFNVSLEYFLHLIQVEEETRRMVDNLMREELELLKAVSNKKC